MNKTLQILITLFFSGFIFAQKDMSVYNEHIKLADSLIKQKDYKGASQEFQKHLNRMTERLFATIDTILLVFLH